MATKTTSVNGMTCDHCARAVREELTGLDGVGNVEVDVAAGRVTVTATPFPDDAALRAAIEEAGYEIVLPARRYSISTSM